MWELPGQQADLVTVVVPTYNRASILADAINSAYEQTYRPIELIIVDDGSNDSTKEVVANFSEKVADDKSFTIRYILRTNEGCQKARNLGIKESKGEFIQLLDSDDILCQNKIQNAVDIYKNDPGIDLVFTCWVVDNGRRIIPMSGLSLSGISLVSDVVLHNLCILSPLYRRKTMEEVGPFNKDLLDAHDIEYCTRVMQRVKKVRKDDACGGVYRIGKTENSITGSSSYGALLSEWRVNRWQKKIIQAEPPETMRDHALDLITRRAHAYVKKSLQANCPGLGLQILLTEYRIWFPITPKATVKCLVLVLMLVLKRARNLFGGLLRV